MRDLKTEPQVQAIEVKSLVKRYGDFQALRGVDLSLRRGEIFAILGPNGAGKTTLLEILEGYSSWDSGSVSILGQDPRCRNTSFRKRLGIVLQYSAIEPQLRVKEVATMYCRIYGRKREPGGLLGLVDLVPKAKDRVGSLSGGELRRLDLALALSGDPEVLFLDEPTTGLDPAARQRFWDLLKKLRDDGKTIVLSTHYMDEAHAISDRLAILVDGKVEVLGTAARLLSESQSTVIRFQLPEEYASAAIDSLGIPLRVEGRKVRLECKEPTKILNRLTSWALEARFLLEGLSVEQPSLEELYLEMTTEKYQERAE